MISTYPCILEHEILEIMGKDRVEAVRYRDNRTGREEEIACDTVLFSVGLIPERDLLIDAGIEPGKACISPEMPIMSMIRWTG